MICAFSPAKAGLLLKGHAIHMPAVLDEAVFDRHAFIQGQDMIPHLLKGGVILDAEVLLAHEIRRLGISRRAQKLLERNELVFLGCIRLTSKCDRERQRQHRSQVAHANLLI